MRLAKLIINVKLRWRLVAVQATFLAVPTLLLLARLSRLLYPPSWEVRAMMMVVVVSV